MIPRIAKALQRAIPKSKFARGVSILVGGTAGAQVITILAMPFVTRLYTPTDFNVVAIFASLVGVISAVSCLRLEIAIPMPKYDSSAANLAAAAFLANTIISAVLTFALLIFAPEINSLIGDQLGNYIYLLPIGVWATGVYFVLQYWSVRQKIFGVIAGTRVSQAITSTGTQIGLGLIGGFGALGLILGQIFTNAAGIFNLFRIAWINHHKVFCSISRKEILAEFINYKDYPKFSTLEAFANVGAIQFPVILIATYATGPEAGFLMLATRIMSAPMGLISGSISQVYLSEASIEMREGNLLTYTLKIILKLFKLGAPTLMTFALISPIAFALVFGDLWIRSGEMLIWMAPWFVMQLLASPVSMALHVTGNQKIALALQLFGLLLRVGVTLAFGIYLPKYIVEGYAISGFLFYLLYLSVIIWTLNQSDVEIKEKLISPKKVNRR